MSRIIWLFLAFSTTASAGITNPSPHRKVVEGVGNCVFSNQPLTFKDDANFKLKTEFEGPEEVWVRCYYPKTVGEYRSEGKILSQLRGNAQQRPQINRRLQFEPPRWFYQHTVSAASKYHTRDQSYLEIMRTGNCDMRKVPVSGPCIDLEAEVRNLATQQKASLPFTTQICMHIDFDVVDKKIPNPENRLQMINKTQFVTISKGCFNYTVR